MKPKAFKTARRQFAEAILGRAVLVVEGSTELAVFSAASSVLEAALGPAEYTHLDVAGVTLFDAGGDGSVPRFGSVFKSLGKLAFGFFDKQKRPLTDDAKEKLALFDRYWESPESGIEALLVKEMPVSTLKVFLEQASNRGDYPLDAGVVTTTMSADDVRALAKKVLCARKGDSWGYAGSLVAAAGTIFELPDTIRSILIEINRAVSTGTDVPPEAPPDVLPPLEAIG